jgi:phosphoglycolate phosphatase-like HAD superfamily hydrolase
MNKLVLFDVDGTIIKQGNRKHKLSFAHAFEKIFGVSASIDIIDYSGRTDKEIIIETLKKVGLDEKEIMPKLDETVKEMAEFYKNNLCENELESLIGVDELLPALEGEGVLLGLVTGNIEAIAREKLKNVNLGSYFKVGGFGDEDQNRTNLVKIAIKKARDIGFNPDEVFVIGDTPRDIKCGKESGSRTIAVATGKHYTRKDLEACNPDFVFDDLSCKKEVLGALLNK